MKASALAWFLSGGCAFYVLAMWQASMWQHQRPGLWLWLLVFWAGVLAGAGLLSLAAAAARDARRAERRDAWIERETAV